jgi:hypothetical protein
MRSLSNITLALVILGLVAFGCLGGIIYLAAHQLSVPDVLVGTLGATVGSIGTILVARPSSPPA